MIKNIESFQKIYKYGQWLITFSSFLLVLSICWNIWSYLNEKQFFLMYKNNTLKDIDNIWAFAKPIFLDIFYFFLIIVYHYGTHAIFRNLRISYSTILLWDEKLEIDMMTGQEICEILRNHGYIRFYDMAYLLHLKQIHLYYLKLLSEKNLGSFIQKYDKNPLPFVRKKMVQEIKQ